MTDRRFKIVFAPGAVSDYKGLDKAVRNLVDKKLEDLTFRADQVGKILSNTNHAKLAGCREIKLKDAGYRIVYRVVGERVEIEGIVLIIAIGRREGEEVFIDAHNRIEKLVRTPVEELKELSENFRKAIESITRLRR